MIEQDLKFLYKIVTFPQKSIGQIPIEIKKGYRKE